MIVFVDPFNRGLSHVSVNAGLIETAVASYPDESLLVAAHDEHLAGLLESLDEKMKSRLIAQITIDPAPAGTRFLERLHYDLRNLRKVIETAADISTLILADLAPSTLYALRVVLMTSRRHKPRKIVAVLHGNASELAGWRARNPLIRLTQLRSAMRIAPGMTCFLVLEDAIRDRLSEVAPEYAHQFASFPHPLPSKEGAIPSGERNKEDDLPSKFRNPIRIAFLGAAQGQKGFGEFLKLAEQIGARLPGKAEFHAIGWMSEDRAPRHFSSLVRQPGTRKLSRDEFLEAVQSIDYVCLPYSRDLYQYSASGTLLDAIAATKPIFAIASPTLEDLRKNYGDIGFLAENMPQLTQQMETILSHPDIKHYQEQIRTLQQIRNDRLPENLITRWRHLVEGGTAD